MQSNEQAMQQAMRLARSAQGQQLLNLLQEKNADALRQAANCASQGDYAQAQKVLSKLLADPEAQKLLSALGGHP